MNDSPDKIDFIQRRVWMEQFESIPRRRQDKRIFERLEGRQEDAYNLIEEAHGYEMAGLPVARMRYEERIDGGYDWELTPRQLQAVFDYREWLTIMHRKRLNGCVFAVLAYMQGASVQSISLRLRTCRGHVGLFIAEGLNEYCVMKRWPIKETRKPIRIRGMADEQNIFQADAVDDLGRPVRIFSEEASPS